MGNLLTYSGLTTKVRAMESRFITRPQLEELASLSSVGEALDFIRSQPAYTELLSSADSSIHRSDLEKLLTLSRYRDFEKLYRVRHRNDQGTIFRSVMNLRQRKRKSQKSR